MFIYLSVDTGDKRDDTANTICNKIQTIMAKQIKLKL